MHPTERPPWWKTNMTNLLTLSGIDLSTGLEVHRYLATSGWLNTMARISAVYPFCHNTQEHRKLKLLLRAGVTMAQVSDNTQEHWQLKLLFCLNVLQHRKLKFLLTAENIMAQVTAVYSVTTVFSATTHNNTESSNSCCQLKTSWHRSELCILTQHTRIQEVQVFRFCKLPCLGNYIQQHRKLKLLLSDENIMAQVNAVHSVTTHKDTGSSSV